MFSTSESTYSLPPPISCLDAITCNENVHGFLFASAAIVREGGKKNAVHVLTFSEETNALTAPHLPLALPGSTEAVSMSCLEEMSNGSKDPDVGMILRDAEGYEAGIYTLTGVGKSLEEVEDDLEDDTRGRSVSNSSASSQISSADPPAATLATLWSVEKSEVPLHTCAVHASNHSTLLVSSTQGLQAYDIGSRSSTWSTPKILSENYDITSLSSDPHDSNLITCTVGTSLMTFDMRQEKAAHVIEGVDAYLATCGDYNPNRPHMFVSGGEDGLAKIWDFRSSSSSPSPPLLTLRSHTHHLTSVRYNRFHDQLLSTCGSDGSTLLWRVGTVSSSPLLELNSDEDDETSKSSADKLVQSVEGESGCMGVAWSKCDAWVYVSVEWDGGVVVNHVPSEEKYKILL
ncbi:hypothetical protein TrVE_jg12371 [Triparma verrucosa]|uniref:EIPR1-like beta-propeller domain-containing protein n=1 Tax=Triparma verrucosa TaxID=1606542 RepID=A0A9W7FBC1_9STRA|nr:hypothetical protein TrVE_jg12371 [Triparma verrucosa]